MQIPHPFILLSLLAVASAQNTRSRSRTRVSSSAQAGTSSAAVSDTPSSQLSTLPANVSPTISIPVAIPSNTLAARVAHLADSLRIPMLPRDKSKETLTAIPSSVSANPNLPRELDADLDTVPSDANTKTPKPTSAGVSAADQTTDAVLKVSAAGEIPSNLPTIAFPTGSMLPLIPTPKASMIASNSVASVPTTLAKKVRHRGIIE